MSHYAVAVFSDDCDFERLLAPYNECDEKYFVFHEVPYEDIVSEFEKFKEHNPKWTLEMFIENERYIQEDGKWGYRSNPNGYWDYYSLDGKEYLFDVPEETALRVGNDDWTGYYRKNDYIWYPDDPEAKKDACEFWDDFIGENAKCNPPGFYTRGYYLERYVTKDQYVKEMGRTTPYAFITPDGKWHAPGRVGWFAISDETADDYNKYLEEWDAFIASEGNPYVSLVDCHI